MPEIVCGHSVAEFQRGNTNEKIGKRETHASSLILTIDLPCAQPYCR